MWWVCLFVSLCSCTYSKHAKRQEWFFKVFAYPDKVFLKRHLTFENDNFSECLFLLKLKLFCTFNSLVWMSFLPWTSHCSEFLLLCPLPLWLKWREGGGQQSWWEGWKVYLCWVAEDSWSRLEKKRVRGNLIASCSFLRRGSTEGGVGLFTWEQIKAGPGEI